MRILLSLLVACTLALDAAHAQSASKKPVATVAEAKEAAAAKQRLIFIAYGREACGNCRHHRKLIKEREIRLPDFEWVQAEMDCDNPTTRKEFNRLYRAMLGEARTLPFVVVTTADGAYVDSITGFQSAENYEKFIRSARAKARKAAAKPGP